MVVLLQIPKEDYKKTIVYLFMLNKLLEAAKKNPLVRGKKLKELNKQILDLTDFIEKYENIVLNTVED